LTTKAKALEPQAVFPPRKYQHRGPRLEMHEFQVEVGDRKAWGNERMLLAVDMMKSGRIFGMNEKGLLPSSGGFGRI
jgi:hypothetical protein